MIEKLMELFRTRQSCRNFSEKPVEKEKLVRCAEAARLAPSACNSQPWEFVAVCGGPARDRAAQCAQALGANLFAEKCPAFVAVAEKPAGLYMYRTGKQEKNQQYAQFDLGLAVMQFCLAATAQGLATCIMGAVDKQKLKQQLGISGDEEVRVLIAVGYPASPEIRAKQRKNLDEVFHFVE
ncbi:MAG: nitroreductase family protein [Oscillospiraceae bacterium]|jgi:nitroreductase|nr:nitroreductase family protein [Oscillospiraceae bacterium]